MSSLPALGCIRDAHGVVLPILVAASEQRGVREAIEDIIVPLLVGPRIFLLGCHVTFCFSFLALCWNISTHESATNGRQREKKENTRQGVYRCGRGGYIICPKLVVVSFRWGTAAGGD